MKGPDELSTAGCLRIVEIDLWDRANLYLCRPATLTITAHGGKITFDAMEAGLDVEYERDSIGFRWAGWEEGDEVEETAELLDDGTIEIVLAYRNSTTGRHAVFELQGIWGTVQEKQQ